MWRLTSISPHPSSSQPDPSSVLSGCVAAVGPSVDGGAGEGLLRSSPTFCAGLDESTNEYTWKKILFTVESSLFVGDQCSWILCITHITQI